MCWFKLLLVHKGFTLSMVLGAKLTLGVVDTLGFKSTRLIHIMSHSIEVPRYFVQFMFVLVRPKYVLKLVFEFLVVAVGVREIDP